MYNALTQFNLLFPCYLPQNTFLEKDRKGGQYVQIGYRKDIIILKHFTELCLKIKTCPAKVLHSLFSTIKYNQITLSILYTILSIQIKKCFKKK